VERIKSGYYTVFEKSRITFCSGAELSLLEDENADHAWVLNGSDRIDFLENAVRIGSALFFPASYENLVIIKNRLLEDDPESTVFPRTSAKLASSTLGIGARFTTLHWPAVEWAMAKLGIGLTVNQNSVPRELVYDVDAMLDKKLESVPLPFIGTSVPQDHQGQGIEGMSHGAILSKLKTGFHLKRIAWSFNADHQPIGAKFDVREDRRLRDTPRRDTNRHDQRRSGEVRQAHRGRTLRDTTLGRAGRHRTRRRRPGRRTLPLLHRASNTR